MLERTLSPDEIFFTLPEALQNKIKPPQLQQAERNRQAKMNASVFPVEYRSAVSAQRARSSGTAPLTNRGVTVGLSSALNVPSIDALEILKVVAVGKRGKSEFIRIPLKDKGRSVKHSFVDYLSFTFKSCDLSLESLSGHGAVTDSEYVTCLSITLQNIFGYGVTADRQSPLNFYANSYDLGIKGWGMVCIGGQKDSVQVTVKGQGLLSAKPGWETRLKRFLESVPGSKLTRVDLATDSFNSRLSVDDYLDMYKAGLFNVRGKLPNVECVGNWLNPTGKGRTLYVGSRSSGKLLRIYEKGLQLAGTYHDLFDKWVRVELELKNEGRVIPFDSLTCPGQYLAGAYPALAGIHEVQSTVKTFRKIVKSTFERSIEVTRNQFGKYIYTIIGILGVEKGLERLTQGKEKVPGKIDFQTFAGIDNDFFIHNVKPNLSTI